jgi:sugar/nucleoside kinase (ribokinase family)
MRMAAIAGSLAVTKEGAQPSFPTRAEIEAAAAGS